MAKRVTKITRNYLMHPIGSVLIETGNTKVICTVTYEEKVPFFLDSTSQGWLTAEYGMLPGATNVRYSREASRGKISGRTAEIQRLIGRSLRSVVDLSKLIGITIHVDCDVIQADGGTRTASITGACVALQDAFQKLLKMEIIEENPLKEFVAAISVGIYNDDLVLDLCYEEDSQAEVDMNVIMTESGNFVEIQGTAEGKTFSESELNSMLSLARRGIKELIEIQKSCF